MKNKYCELNEFFDDMMSGKTSIIPIISEIDEDVLLPQRSPQFSVSSDSASQLLPRLPAGPPLVLMPAVGMRSAQNRGSSAPSLLLPSLGVVGLHLFT